MKRHELLAVLLATTGLALSSVANASIPRDVAHAPDVTVAVSDKNLSSLIQVAQAKGFERSGNPKAAGGVDNPGVGNKHTPS